MDNITIISRRKPFLDFFNDEIKIHFNAFLKTSGVKKIYLGKKFEKS